MLSGNCPTALDDLMNMFIAKDSFKDCLCHSQINQINQMKSSLGYYSFMQDDHLHTDVSGRSDEVVTLEHAKSKAIQMKKPMR